MRETPAPLRETVVPFSPLPKRFHLAGGHWRLIRVFQDTDNNGFLDGGFKNGVIQIALFSQDIETYYFFLGYVRNSMRKQKKKLTDTGLLEIPWILDVKGFSDG